MSILAAILILGATGSARAEMEVPEKRIGEIVASVAWGAAKDVANTNNGGSVREWFARGNRPSVELQIDGQSREGIQAWGEGLWRVGGFVLSDGTSDGSLRGGGLAGSGRGDNGPGKSVEYTYGLHVRRYHIVTSTRIVEGNVTKTVDAWWTETVVIPIPKGLRWLLGTQIVRRISIHVRIVIVAVERNGSVVLVGTASGTADTGDFRCGRVRFRHAEPEASTSLNIGLREALDTIQREGTRYYRAGADDLGEVLDRIGLGIRGIRILRR